MAESKLRDRSADRGLKTTVPGRAQNGFCMDIILCIDGTQSGDTNRQGNLFLDRTKAMACRICEDICRRMEQRAKAVEQCRVRVIVFRDYLADGEKAMEATDFMSLPQQEQTLSACINGIRGEGGGDVPEDALEALAYAIKSPWQETPLPKRQIIILWSDAEAHPLGYGSASPFYPQGMAESMDELTDWWEEMDPRAKRLCLFTPCDPSWWQISEVWDRTGHFPSFVFGSFSQEDYSAVLDMIVGNV